MERYNEYKDSGIFWQPQIPNNWIVKKLGYVLKKHNRPRPLGAELLVCTNKATVIKKGDSKMGMISENEEIYQGVAVGDLLIHGMDTWHGAIAISKYDGMCTPVVHVCTSEEDVAYISYYLRNMATQKVFKLISNGVRQNTSDFRGWDKVKEILCPIPPLSEQQAIAAYLDTVTSKIDTAIAQQQKMIDLLNERKQIIINNAVTKGLNPNVKMKDSGVDWIGEIPEHWEVMPIKRIKSREKNAFVDGPFGSNLKSEHFIENGEVYVIESGLITTGKYVHRELKTISKSHFETIKRSECRANDIIIAKIGARFGMAGELPELGKTCVVSGNSLKLTLDKSLMLNGMFVNYMGLAKNKGGFIGLYQETAQPALSLGALNNMILPVPPIKEQFEILEKTNEKLATIDYAISNATKQIALLQERKQIIINEVVTGKVKVC